MAAISQIDAAGEVNSGWTRLADVGVTLG